MKYNTDTQHIQTFDYGVVIHVDHIDNDEIITQFIITNKNKLRELYEALTSENIFYFRTNEKDLILSSPSGRLSFIISDTCSSKGYVFNSDIDPEVEDGLSIVDLADQIKEIAKI